MCAINAADIVVGAPIPKKPPYIQQYNDRQRPTDEMQDFFRTCSLIDSGTAVVLVPIFHLTPYAIALLPVTSPYHSLKHSSQLLTQRLAYHSSSCTATRAVLSQQHRSSLQLSITEKKMTRSRFFASTSDDEKAATDNRRANSRAGPPPPPPPPPPPQAAHVAVCVIAAVLYSNDMFDSPSPAPDRSGPKGWG